MNVQQAELIYAVVSSALDKLTDSQVGEMIAAPYADMAQEKVPALAA